MIIYQGSGHMTSGCVTVRDILHHCLPSPLLMWEGNLLLENPVKVALMSGNHISQQPNCIYIGDRERMTA